jgi:hypothetical protein
MAKVVDGQGTAMREMRFAARHIANDRDLARCAQVHICGHTTRDFHARLRWMNNFRERLCASYALAQTL